MGSLSVAADVDVAVDTRVDDRATGRRRHYAAAAASAILGACQVSIPAGGISEE